MKGDGKKKEKGIALLVLEGMRKKGPKGVEDDAGEAGDADEGDHMDVVEEASQEVLDAIEANDAKALAGALRTIIRACSDDHSDDDE